MMDFLKTYPSFTMEQYLWEIPLPKLRLMQYDATRVFYLTEKQAKRFKGSGKAHKIDNKTYSDADGFAAALNIPSF